MLQSPTLLSRVLEAAPKPKTTSGVSWLSYKTVLSFVSTKVGKKKGFVDFVDRVTVIVSEELGNGELGDEGRWQNDKAAFRHMWVSVWTCAAWLLVYCALLLQQPRLSDHGKKQSELLFVTYGSIS